MAKRNRGGGIIESITGTSRGKKPETAPSFVTR
jgi:hypothetical protein